jgi:hypothetical protein
MQKWCCAAVLSGVGLLLATAGPAEAAKTITARTSGARNTGARNDITVPYLTSGRSTFMNGNVAPRIYSSPVVDDPNHPQQKKVYNLIYYGAKQGFGDKSNGATDRTAK